jgi:hypothetical protein
MKYNILFVLFLLLSIVPPAIAQSDNALGYSEVVSGVFAADETTHEWTFNGAERDIIQITARRIRGVATPRISLSTADGNPLTPAQTEETSTTQTLWFYEGLPASGDYVISIHGENIQADVINPDEYSLELLKLGERKADPEAGLTIPRVDAPPTLENGTPATRDDERGRITFSIQTAWILPSYMMVMSCLAWCVPSPFWMKALASPPIMGKSSLPIKRLLTPRTITVASPFAWITDSRSLQTSSRSAKFRRWKGC